MQPDGQRARSLRRTIARSSRLGRHESVSRALSQGWAWKPTSNLVERHKGYLIPNFMPRRGPEGKRMSEILLEAHVFGSNGTNPNLLPFPFDTGFYSFWHASNGVWDSGGTVYAERTCGGGGRHRYLGPSTVTSLYSAGYPRVLILGGLQTPSTSRSRVCLRVHRRKPVRARRPGGTARPRLLPATDTTRCHRARQAWRTCSSGRGLTSCARFRVESASRFASGFAVRTRCHVVDPTGSRDPRATRGPGPR